jgi:hypothetical protein
MSAEWVARWRRKLPEEVAQSLGDLLAEYKLAIDPAVVGVIADEYQKYASRRSTKPKRLGVTQRARRSALAHITTLLRKQLTRRSTAVSISDCSRRLFRALTKPSVWFEVQLESRSKTLWMPAILALLENGTPPAVRDLRTIEATLVNLIAANSKRSGRAIDPRTRVARLGHIIWLDCGRSSTLAWDPINEKAVGATSNFIRNFMNVFGIRPSEHALKAILRRLRPGTNSTAVPPRSGNKKMSTSGT